MTIHPKSLITSAEASALLRIDRATLSRWVRDGKLAPAWQLPGETGARLFRRTDVEQLKAQEAAS